MSIVDASAAGIDELLGEEWLSVNQIGGYACSTPACLNTRKYHGLLVAAMAPPVRRMVLLSRVEESLIVADEPEPIALACSEYPGTIHPDGHLRLRGFAAEPFPRWVYQADGITIEKTLHLVRGENTVVISYTLLGGGRSATLELRPLFALRGIHELTYQWNAQLDAQDRSARHHRIPPTSRTPEVFFAHDGKFEPGGCWYMSTIYRRECERGYAGLEDLWMPGVVRWMLLPGKSVHFVCSGEPIELRRVLKTVQSQTAPVEASIIVGAATDPTLDALLRAAEQFVLIPPAHAPKGASRPSINVIAQYPWSPPSGRDALIGFAGLFLVPKRFDEASQLLSAMASQMREGIMPGEFPEDGSAPVYSGADTSLWFVNAVWSYLRYTGNEPIVRDKFFETILRIIRRYQGGVSMLGISMDEDGLIASHVPGQGTSWMDAKVGDWVITPRQGRCVELNALWYNAVRIASELCEKFERPTWSAEFERLAESVRQAFNRRFWNVLAGCCFDVVNDRGADPSIRPNQILAVGLPYAVLAPEYHQPVVQKVRSLLLTRVGLRTLDPSDPSYQGHYRGDVVSRDRAYHQGSAYPWLLGPLATAMLKVNGRSAQARVEVLRMLQGCLNHLQGAGMGQLPELFDGDAPHHAGGATASARSVGQILRAYVEEVLDFTPQQQRSGAAAPAPPVRPPVQA